VEITTGMLRKMLKSTTALIEQIIQLELSYINTNHPDFIGVSQLLKDKDKDKQGPSLLPSLSRFLSNVSCFPFFVDFFLLFIDSEIETLLIKHQQQSEQQKEESGFFRSIYCDIVSYQNQKYHIVVHNLNGMIPLVFSLERRNRKENKANQNNPNHLLPHNNNNININNNRALLQFNKKKSVRYSFFDRIQR
jgi:hypothetical protein